LVLGNGILLPVEYIYQIGSQDSCSGGGWTFLPLSSSANLIHGSYAEGFLYAGLYAALMAAGEIGRGVL